MKHIALAQSVTRCRPQPPLTQLHNDCGRQSECARRLAANIQCHPTQDFSKSAMAHVHTVLCQRFVPLAGAEHYRDPVEPKPMQGSAS